MLSKILKLSILILFLFSSIALLAQPGAESFVIAGITVEGNRFADAETIISLSGLRVGNQLALPADNKLQTALRNLWKRKQFSDVDIIVDRVTPAGVFLIIKLKEFDRLNEIEVRNNEEVDTEDITKAIGKVKGDIISKYDLYLFRRDIKKLYADEGLAFAKVEVELEPTDTVQYSNLIIYVEEGIEFYVNSINIEGNKFFDDDDLISEFDETKTKSWWQIWKSSKFDLNDYKNDIELLKKFYQNNGFVDVDIISDSVQYNEEKETVDITINLVEGSKLFIRNIRFEGNTVYKEKALLRRLEFKPGDPYDLETFEMNLRGNQEQTDALSLYANSGYLAAQFEKDEKRIGTDSVDIIINVYENDRFKIRRVDVTGNTKTKDKVIRRELYTRPGDYFDRSAVIRSIRALGVMNYFNPEALQPQVNPVDNTSVDVVYKVEERSTDTFNASIGFAGSFGLTGAVGFTFNNFSLSEPLQGGGGQIFNFNWEFGQFNRLQTFSIGFTEPWLMNEPTTIGFNLFDSRINFNYELRRTGLSVNLGRRFKWPDDYFRADWSLRYQENDVGTSGGTFFRPGINQEVTIGQTISRISLNSMFFPTVGSRFSYSTNFAMGAIGLGTTDFFKNELNFEIYNPLLKVDGMDRLVLYLSSKMGYIAGFESDTAISPIELYFMGGNGLGGFGVIPFRGYPDRSIGPRNGGKVMSRYIAELRFSLSQGQMPIFLYGFAEAGNVWENIKNTDPFQLKRSAGIGIQMLLNPIGIIGFSYGYGFDALGTAKEPTGWQFLFHLGQQ